MLDHLAKLPDVRCLSSEEQEKYDESIKAVDDYRRNLVLFSISAPLNQISPHLASPVGEGQIAWKIEYFCYRIIDDAYKIIIFSKSLIRSLNFPSRL